MRMCLSVWDLCQSNYNHIIHNGCQGQGDKATQIADHYHPTIYRRVQPIMGYFGFIPILIPTIGQKVLV